jgi:hypothetical protein
VRSQLSLHDVYHTCPWSHTIQIKTLYAHHKVLKTFLSVNETPYLFFKLIIIHLNYIDQMASDHVLNDYGNPAIRSNRLHRPAILANHALHWASSIIVMSIAAYFIANFPHNTHLRYWISVVSVAAILLPYQVQDLTRGRPPSMLSCTSLHWFYLQSSLTKDTSLHLLGSSPICGSRPLSLQHRIITTVAQLTLLLSSTSARWRKPWRHLHSLLSKCHHIMDPSTPDVLWLTCAWKLYQPCWLGPRG